jgi:signal peptidase I
VTNTLPPTQPSDTPSKDTSSNDHPQDEKVDWLAEARGLLVMLLTVLAFHSFIAKPFFIPSISMMPNLLVGDRLVVSKYPYGWNWSSVSFHLLPRSSWRVLGQTPEYGDIVIVVPRNRNEDLIKRVIGLPGDRVAMVQGQVILNGKPVPRMIEPPLRLAADKALRCDNGYGSEYCYNDFGRKALRLPDGQEVIELPTFRETLPNGASYLTFDTDYDGLFDTMPEVTVPAGHVFLMGDNRDHSADSRVPMAENGLGGPVPLSNIGGRAEFITFSLNGTESFNPLTWWRALRSGRAWRSLRPQIMPVEAASPRTKP